ALSAGETEVFALTVTQSELDSSSGQLTLGFEARGNGGLALAAPTLQGMTAAAQNVQASSSVALFTITAPGTYLLEIKGGSSTASGSYTLEGYVAGDTDGNFVVNGAD